MAQDAELKVGVTVGPHAQIGEVRLHPAERRAGCQGAGPEHLPAQAFPGLAEQGARLQAGARGDRRGAADGHLFQAPEVAGRPAAGRQGSHSE
ncbi:hypothetical protein G6F59_017883 [Rhizopus arrhizus]|nr:hypothetical protein G6F59_017883 [Rhizopus arrhizus]